MSISSEKGSPQRSTVPWRNRSTSDWPEPGDATCAGPRRRPGETVGARYTHAAVTQEMGGALWKARCFPCSLGRRRRQEGSELSSFSGSRSRREDGSELEGLEVAAELGPQVLP